jgi:hypothetical protein
MSLASQAKQHPQVNSLTLIQKDPVSPSVKYACAICIYILEASNVDALLLELQRFFAPLAFQNLTLPNVGQCNNITTDTLPNISDLKRRLK